MNVNMHGKKIRIIEYMDGPTGNPAQWVHGMKWSEGQTMELSATYHGDRDEFWIVLRDSTGKEMERRRAATMERIVWLDDSPENGPERQV